MRLRRLDLLAIGPFQGVTLDLSGGKQGLHLIYGRNEAGKTTALRSLNCLLFGFPHRAPEVAFAVANDRLRVGGLLEGQNGESLDVIRRKGRTHTLRREDDTATADEAVLSRWLGGIDEDTFRTLFGIDHQRLRQAGEQIRTGNGQFGELLFAAASGLKGLRDVQADLKSRTDGYFRPKGQNQRINKAIAELREAQAMQTTAMLRSDVWVRQEQALQEAQRKGREIEAKVAGSRQELGRLERIERAFPLIARYDELREQLEAIGEVFRLRESFEEELRATQIRLEQERRSQVEAGGQVKELRERLAEVEAEVPEEILAAREEVEILTQEVGRYRKDRKDLPDRIDMKKGCEHRARDLLQELGRPRELKEAEGLRLRADEALMIQNQGAGLGKLQEKNDKAAEEIERQGKKLREVERALAGLSAAPELQELTHATKQARKAGELDKQLAREQAARASREEDAGRALRKLPDWSRTIEELEELKVPVDETVERLEETWDELTKARADAGVKVEDKQAEVKQRESELRAMERGLPVPTEEDLAAARGRRQWAWRRVRAEWLGEPLEEEAAGEGSSAQPGGASLATEHERSVGQSDELADRLRREADRVARKTECLAQIEVGERELAALREHQEKVEAEAKAFEGRWGNLLEEMGLSQRRPRELRSWLGKRLKVVELAEQCRETSREVARLEQERNGHLQEVERALRAAKLPMPEEVRSLEQLLDHAEQLVKAAEKQARERQKLSEERERLREEVEEATERARVAKAELAAWREQWGQRMSRLGLEEDASPEQANLYLDKIRELFDQLKEARNFEQRIDGIERDIKKFEERARGAAIRLAPELADEEGEKQAQALAERLREAERFSQERDQISGLLKKEEQAFEKARKAVALAEFELQQLMEEAGCKEVEELPSAVRQARERAQREESREKCEEQIRIQSGGATLAAFIEEVRQEDADAIRPRIAGLQEELERLGEELTRANQEIGLLRGEFLRMNGADDAAAAADRVQCLLEQLRCDVQEYSRLRLATAVLKRGIERYRERNQGPVLERASRLFAVLTCGSFAGLKIDYDDSGLAVLMGERADNSLVGVEGMSDGSHDQLYLALRLASLENWLETHEPVPFIVDDILLNFDNERATAALQALAELSRLTQVILFTHHEHLVDLAEETLLPSVVFVQRLPERS